MIKIILIISIVFIIFILGNAFGQSEGYKLGKKEGAYKILKEYMLQLCCSDEINNDDKPIIRKYHDILWNKIDNDDFFKKS